MSIHDPFEKWSFQDLVDYNTGNILQGLIRGDLRDAVHSASNLAVRWRVAQDEEIEKEKKAKRLLRKGDAKVV